MHYHSTRGAAPPVDFEEAILTGLAPDGGLYLPDAWPVVDDATLAGWADLSYPDVVAEVLGLFSGDLLDPDDCRALCADAYAGFGHPDVAPLVPLAGLRLMELFWGPTLAFKDHALQVLSRLMDAALERRGGRVTVIGATSGDTGSAAIEAFRDRHHIDLVFLYPAGRVSEVQRRQMTTVDAPNVAAVAVRGTFDDCQDLVKGLFADPGARHEFGLTTANSINVGRLIPQIAYYVWGLLRAGAGVSFAVPSGNFGNVYSGHAARRMTGAIDTLVVGANRNHVLVDFIDRGELTLGEVHPTVAPSMDIQIPSNLERLLAELTEDGAALAAAMQALRTDGRLQVPGEPHGFRGSWYDDAAVRDTIRRVHDETGTILDPHTAIGVAAARQAALPGPVVALATAHPAKFPDVVEEAIGVRPTLPDHLADLLERPERTVTIDADLAQFRAAVAGVR